MVAVVSERNTGTPTSIEQRQSSTARMLQILGQEGIATSFSLPPFFQKSDRLMDASRRLFNNLLMPEGDPRWFLAYQYMHIMVDGHFRRLPFSLFNAGIADYLSAYSADERPSRRRFFTQSVLESNIRQVARSVQNLAAYPDVKGRFETTEQGFADSLPEGTLTGLRFAFAVTENVGRFPEHIHKANKPRRRGRNSLRQGITSCPEALYQVRLFDGEEYIGRVGFNIHVEDDRRIMSIANIQGIPGSKDRFDAFEQQRGVNPLNLVLQRLKVMAAIEGEEQLELRGIGNPRNPDRKTMYYTLLKRKGRIPMYISQRTE